MAKQAISPADDALDALKLIVSKPDFLSNLREDLSETDTRVKLIDPLFKTVLGWKEADILREEPASDGFADYTFGTDYKWFHVEAKRLLPRFEMHAKSEARKLKLTGAHLLGNKQVKPVIEQAAKYAPDLGTQFALVTNSVQFILFEATPRGKSWRDGYALVWHSYQDIIENFAAFYALLSRSSVTAGSLREEFAKTISVTRQLFTPLDYIHNPDAELVRNPFWSKISQAFSSILIDQPENASLQEEIVKNCYVSTPLASESRSFLGGLLRDLMPHYVKAAGASNIQMDEKGTRKFQNKIVEDLKLARPSAYILTGGVGSGKTSFLRRFSMIDEHAYIKSWCVWLHIDYLPIGDVSVGLQARIEDYTYQQILLLINEKYPAIIPKTGDEIRSLFQPEIDELKLTLLHGADPLSEEYRREVSRLVNELAANKAKYTHAILRSIRKVGKSLVFVLDNTDQQGEAFQKSVFLFSQHLSNTYSTLCIVSLREEKFFAAYKQGVFDAYGTRNFHIGSPELIDVIKKRLAHGFKRFYAIALQEKVPTHELERTGNVARALVQSSTDGNSNIIRFLACVSSGDMRLALSMFNDFMSSGNTDTTKILKIVGGRNPGMYKMPFHEFAKSAILGSRRYYKGSVSRILNLFSLSAAPGASHWTATRLLARLQSGRHVSSPYGEGYLQTNEILREYRESFGIADDLIESAGKLLASGLLESEPPRLTKLTDTEAVRITATGAYYWSFLIRSFAYIDLVLVDTPCTDENLARELGRLSELRKEDHTLSQYMNYRIDRVELFLKHLATCDEAEIKESSRQGGPYQALLSTEIHAQIDKEVIEIRRRTRA
jgi:hypothetical protein